MKDIECPYCGEPQDINHDDGYGYEEDVRHEQHCVECNKAFVFTTSISFYYEPSKADCLNNGEHKYKPNMAYPKYFTKMECQTCDKSRNPTDEEKAMFNIPLTLNKDD